MLPIRLFVLALVALSTTPLTAAAQSDCQPAVAQVWQTPTVEGQSTVREFLMGVLLIEGVTPGEVNGWQYGGTPPDCRVTFRFRQGRNTYTLTWQVDPTTGTVDATDARTRGMSGW